VGLAPPPLAPPAAGGRLNRSRRAALAGALAAALLAACSPERAGWRIVDLTRERPTFESYPTGAAPAQGLISYLGSREVRDMSRVPRPQLGAFPQRTAGQIRALEQAAGGSLAWDLSLGEAPYLAFVPLGCARPCAQRVRLRDAAGATHDLYRARGERRRAIAPARAEVDLARFAGQRVRLLFEIEIEIDGAAQAPRAERALWGSPEVASRGELPARRRPRSARLNIVLIGVDTLRADAVGPRSSGPSLTPAIDALVARSEIWPEAYTCVNSTNPSFASLFTGLYAKNHGVYNLQTRLPEAHDTLAELLARAGYRTLAVVSAHHLGDHNSGLGQGFDEVVLAGEHFAAELAVSTAVEWIDRTAAPFFLFLHLFDPHTPHTPPEPYALGERHAAAFGLGPTRAWLAFRPPGAREFSQPVLGGERDLYDGEVAYLDRQVDRLLAFLADRGLAQETVVALLGDHGENLGEHGIDFRHIGLFETTTRVPLVLHRPGVAGGRRAGLVQSIDLFPSLLRAAGVSAPPRDGVDLDRLTGEGRRGRPAVFVEHDSAGGAMVRRGDHRYALHHGVRPLPDGPSLYDLRADPAEEHNLAGTGLAVEAELAELLRAWQAERRATPAAARPHALAPEEIERLRALGYLQ
jgi:arylsulfatase A-like enzyme